MKLIALLGLMAPLAFSQLSNKELERRIDILSEEITNLKAHQMGVAKNESVYGLGNSASKVYFVPQGLSIGAYGEIVYSNQAKEEGDSGDPQLEAQRYVLYVGYKLNDQWLINSEIEIEHVDQIYTEFLYADYLRSQEVNGRFGLMLLPVGFLNELHEPTLFPSVKRPLTEKHIIPTTWREIGVGTFGSVGNYDYKLYYVNGGNADGLSASSGFRKARKKGGASGSSGSTNASTGAVAGRLDYNFTTQSYVGASVYAGEASSSTEENLETQLYDIHAQYGIGGLRVRALYTELNYGNASDFNSASGKELQEKMQGGYLEALYNLWAGKSAASLSPFLRYERINLNAKIDDAIEADGENDFHSYTVGLAYAPVPRLVFKADYAVIENKADNAINEFNLGMGFNF